MAAIGCGAPGGTLHGGPDAGDGGGPQLSVPPAVQVPIDPTTTPVDPVVVTPTEPAKPWPDFTFRPLQTEVKVYSVQLAEADYQALIADPYDDGRPATFTVDGKQLPCTFRVRGGSSRHYPKKSWRIDLPDGTKYGGRKKINLVSEMADRTFMVEKLGFDLLAAMGVPASNANYVRLYVNGRFEGIYLDIERVDKAFLDAHAFADTDADIFRCGDQDCEMKLYRNDWQGEWEKQTNELTGFDPLWSFLGTVNHTPEPDFAKTLEAQFEVGRYLRSMTMDALLSNDIIMDSNDYLIRDRFTKKWTYVPWDLNNANARWWPTYPLNQGPACDGGEGWCDWTRDHPVDDSALVVWSVRDGWLNRLYDERSFGPSYTPAFSNLTTRIVENPELRARYLATLEQALEKLFTPEVMNPRLEAMHALIAPYAKDDPGLKLMPDAVVVNGVSAVPRGSRRPRQVRGRGAVPEDLRPQPERVPPQGDRPAARAHPDARDRARRPGREDGDAEEPQLVGPEPRREDPHHERAPPHRDHLRRVRGHLPDLPGHRADARARRGVRGRLRRRRAGVAAGGRARAVRRAARHRREGRLLLRQALRRLGLRARRGRHVEGHRRSDRGLLRRRATERASLSSASTVGGEVKERRSGSVPVVFP